MPRKKMFKNGLNLTQKLAMIVADAQVTPDGCLVVPDMYHDRGYIRMLHDGRPQTIARLLLEDSGVNMVGLDARHKCKNRGCVNIDHIEPGTHIENMHDRFRDDTFPLSKNVVSDIRSLFLQGVKIKDIAHAYSLREHNVRKIVTLESYNYEQEERVRVPRTLSDEDVRTIRNKHMLGFTQAQLARDYGVSISLMCRIVNGYMYKHVEDIAV